MVKKYVVFMLFIFMVLHDNLMIQGIFFLQFIKFKPFLPHNCSSLCRRVTKNHSKQQSTHNTVFYAIYVTIIDEQCALSMEKHLKLYCW